MSYAPYLCPEDFPGFIGTGQASDYPAISAALAAAVKGQAVRFTGTYATDTPIVPGATPIESGGAATIVPIGGCPTAFELGGPGFIEHSLPRLLGFPGNALVLSGPGIRARTLSIQGLNAGGGVAWAPGCEDCTVDVQFFANLLSCLSVSSPSGVAIQGNLLRANFASACKYGLFYDGSENCDSNEFEMESWDSTAPGGVLIPGAVIFLNSQAAENPQMLSTWKLRVRSWIGGLAPGSAKICAGPRQFCELEVGLLVSSDWAAIGPSGGGGNSYRAACKTGFNSGFVANWQVQPNHRAAFGGPTYMNTVRCNGKCAPVPAGTLVTHYVYTPLADGGSFGFRVMPLVNPGFQLVSIADNSLVNANEAAITWRAMNAISTKAPAEYDEFDFQFTAGVA